MSGYVTRREGESSADFNRRQFWREVDEEKAEREPNAAVTRATWLPGASMARLDRAFADGVEIGARSERLATTFAATFPDGDYAMNAARHVRSDAGNEHIALEWIAAALGREVAS